MRVAWENREIYTLIQQLFASPVKLKAFLSVKEKVI